MAETKYTFCRICEAACGLEASVEEGKVVELRPNPDHIGTQGFACIKGLHQHQLYASPDRVKTPLKRVGQSWQRISWEQAFLEIGTKVKALRSVSPHTIAMYVGTAAGFGFLHPIFAEGFIQGLASRNLFTTGTQDCANKFATAREMYGFPLTMPFPDLDHVQCLIVVGTNPVVSKWTWLQVANPIKRLKGVTARGAKLFFVDPRRTESAKTAGEHIFIRPDTDVFFFLGFLHELLAIGRVDFDRARRFMTGVDELASLASPWTPERVEEVTRIPAHTLRRLVQAYSEADGAALMSGTGVGMGSHGTLAVWLQEVINSISGNLDRKGGVLVGRGVIDFAAFCVKRGILVSDKRSRVGNFPTVNDAFPGAILADEILTKGPEQVRALFVTGGNPVMTMANSARLKEALEKLELLVVTDLFVNETASLAHYVLPATSPLERPDLPFLFPLLLGLQSIPYIAATERLVEPDGEQRDEATIYTDLARACGISLFGSKLAQRFFEGLKWVNGLRRRRAAPRFPQEWLLSLILRSTGQMSFKRLLGFPNGLSREGACAGDFLGKRVYTPDGKVHLAPPHFLEAVRNLETTFERELRTRDQFKLITKRLHTTMNSWMQNLPELAKGPEGRTNFLYVHPEDAAKLGISEGDVVDVSSSVATLRVPVKILAELMPGTVSLPHGWGHQHAPGLNFANKLSGVNVNLLAEDGPDSVEKLSGMSRLTGILVDVIPATGPLCAESWTGIAAG